MKIFLTGLGFVGSKLVTHLIQSPENQLRVVSRSPSATLPAGVHFEQVDSLEKVINWPTLIGDSQVVIHTAARVHVMNDSCDDPLEEYRKVNVRGTLALAEAAAAVGVKRFVFVSSIKVNGEETFPETPYKADDVPAPRDPYGISKLEAEQALQALSSSSGMEVVIVRPVLVYGPRVRANFYNMMNWLFKGVPLPLGAINNKRSLVSIYNLVDFIGVCAKHPRAANQTFLISDGQDLSTTELLQKMGRALGVSVRLLPVPVSMLKLTASIVGKSGISQRLCGFLQVDIEKNRRLLDWVPVCSVEEGLARTAQDFLTGRRA
ncbi:UDP-glucose 4-epimerase [Pseudomonas sp. R1-43-08]|uniref:UDP-glucose 4-epimerase family protein n=1 Tax=Pseudomonas sp. R1-43-08 TaxID=1173270 RepID=UPI000F56BF66|nr:SDR family oxidoreductase [Pseudomonas sp. R1-43-08]AZF41742.1 UDP-glucose 4-epimerase [Pseudomonas sp. R1-43-08]